MHTTTVTLSADTPEKLNTALASLKVWGITVEEHGPEAKLAVQTLNDVKVHLDLAISQLSGGTKKIGASLATEVTPAMSRKRYCELAKLAGWKVFKPEFQNTTHGRTYRQIIFLDHTGDRVKVMLARLKDGKPVALKNIQHRHVQLLREALTAQGL